MHSLLDFIGYDRWKRCRHKGGYGDAIGAFDALAREVRRSNRKYALKQILRIRREKALYNGYISFCSANRDIIGNTSAAYYSGIISSFK